MALSEKSPEAIQQSGQASASQVEKPVSPTAAKPAQR